MADDPLNLTSAQTQAAAPTAPQATKSSPLSGYSGVQKFGLALEAFGAGMQGRKPLYATLNEQDLQRRRQNLADTENRLQIVAQVTTQVQALPNEQRQGYLDAVLGQYDDPQLKELLKHSLDAPDVLSGLGETVKKDPLMRSLTAQGKALDFVKTEAGQKYVRDVQYPAFAQEWSGRLPEWQGWLRTNKPDDYNRIMKDGRLSITEINGMIDQLPENLMPTPQSKSFFLGAHGQDKLSGVLGIPVITDKLAAKKLENELAGGEATTLTKHLGELEEAERNLAGAEGDSKKTAQRRVDALRKKVAAETKTGGSDALKEMRNQIIMKTAKMKEQDPNYKPPAHEQYVVDEYNKSNALERLRRDILEGSGKTEIPTVSSDEEYEKLPSGAEFTDPKGVKRRKP